MKTATTGWDQAPIGWRSGNLIPSRWPRPGSTTRRRGPVTGHKASFASAILPPRCRKSPKVSEVLPLLYLHGLSSSNF